MLWFREYGRLFVHLLGEEGASLDGVEIILQRISEHEEQTEGGAIVTTTEVANTEEVCTCLQRVYFSIQT